MQARHPGVPARHVPRWPEWVGGKREVVIKRVLEEEGIRTVPQCLVRL